MLLHEKIVTIEKGKMTQCHFDIKNLYVDNSNNKICRLSDIANLFRFLK